MFLHVRYMCGGRPGNEANRHVLSSSMMVTIPVLRNGLKMTLGSVVMRLTVNTSFPSQSRSFEIGTSTHSMEFVLAAVNCKFTTLCK